MINRQAGLNLSRRVEAGIHGLQAQTCMIQRFLERVLSRHLLSTISYIRDLTLSSCAPPGSGLSVSVLASVSTARSHSYRVPSVGRLFALTMHWHHLAPTMRLTERPTVQVNALHSLEWRLRTSGSLPACSALTELVQRCGYHPTTHRLNTLRYLLETRFALDPCQTG